MIQFYTRKILQNRILQHILFWCLSYYYLLHFFSPGNPQKIDIIYTSMFHIALVSGVYINGGLLIPLLLKRRRFIIYALMIVALIGAMAALNILMFDKVVDYIFPDYFFISYYSFTELLQFSFIYIAVTTLLKLSRGWFQLLDSENKLIKLESEKTHTELRYLKSQINPHFLFNTLNSIYSLSMRKDDKAPPTLLKLAGVMRYMIYEADGDFVPLEKEINYLKDYIALHQVRQAGKATITFDIRGDAGKQEIAPFLFIVFVENGFKHGIEAGLSDTYLHVSIDIDLHHLCFTVINSKGIVDETENGDYKGLGLENAKKRLQLLYPGRHELEIKDEEDSFTVVLRLDFTHHK